MIDAKELEALSPEWCAAIRLILDEARHAGDQQKDGSIEVLLKAGRPVTVRASGARPITISKETA